jgi:ABC-type sugar transport system permease subunit
MIMPMVGLLGVFVLWPLVYAVWLSLHRSSFYRPPKYVGLAFYRYVLTDPMFWHSIETGLKYAAMVVPISVLIALLLATFIKSLTGRTSSFIKTVVYVPAAVSSIVAALIFQFIYQDQGFGNWFIGLFGVKPVAWLNNPDWALSAVAAPGAWLRFGIATLIMLAGLLDIPDSYYESAALDGANFWQRTWYITIPMLKNVLLFLFVTEFVLAMQEFQLPLIMTLGGPVDATTTPNLYIFNSFRDNTPYATSFSLAASLLLFAVMGTISMIIFRLINSEKAVDG